MGVIERIRNGETVQLNFSDMILLIAKFAQYPEQRPFKFSVEFDGQKITLAPITKPTVLKPIVATILILTLIRKAPWRKLVATKLFRQPRTAKK